MRVTHRDPRPRGGADWEGIQRTISGFCGTLFSSIAGRDWAIYSVARSWISSRNAHLTEPMQGRSRYSPATSSGTLCAPRDCHIRAQVRPVQEGFQFQERPHKSRKSSPVPCSHAPSHLSITYLVASPHTSNELWPAPNAPQKEVRSWLVYSKCHCSKR